MAANIGYTQAYDNSGAQRLLRLRAAGCSRSMLDPTGSRLTDVLKMLRRNDTLTVCTLDCISRSFQERAAICETLAKRGIKVRILDS